MLLWISLAIALISFGAVAALILRRIREGKLLTAAALVDAGEAPSKPVKRRRKRLHLMQTDVPPPPPPPPVPTDAAPAEEVSFDKLISLVEVNMETGNYQLAEQYLEEVRARFMDRPPLLYFERRADLSEREGDLAAAADAMEKVILQDGETVAHYVRLADLYLQLERYEDADRVIAAGFGIAPDHLPLLQLQARLYRKTDDHEKAVAVKQRIHLIEEDLRLRGELPAKEEDLPPAPTA